LRRIRRGAVLACGVLVLHPVAGAGGQSGSEGEELYMEILGCWNCHGRVETGGGGGEGEPLQGTYLPVSLFVKELRLPAETMPPFSPLLATDAELAVVYAWLEGADPVRAPPVVELAVEGPTEVAAGGEIELLVAARRSPARGVADPGPGVRLRVTLFREDNSLVAGLPVRHVEPSGDRESDGATDAYGQMLLGPPDGTPLDVLVTAAPAVTLRFRLEPGRYAVVVEVIEVDERDPAVLGIGSAVLEVRGRTPGGSRPDDRPGDRTR